MPELASRQEAITELGASFRRAFRSLRSLRGRDTHRGDEIGHAQFELLVELCVRGPLHAGELAEVVKNPNYRGVSATFWRSLRMVGNAASFEVHGTLYCGKGEPNQAIHCGHASPPGLFAEVEVFGGL